MHYSEDVQADFLLARGYIICVQAEVLEVNVCQNVFTQEPAISILAIKNNLTESLEKAFEREFKERLKRI